MASAVALGTLGDRSAVPALIEVLRDEVADVRMQSVTALAELGDNSAIPALVEALRDEDEGFYERPSIRICAAEVLAEFGDAAITELLKAVISFPNSSYVVQALRCVCSSPNEKKLAATKEKLKEYSAFEWNRRGFELATQGNYQEAIACFQKAIEIDPEWEEPRKTKMECSTSINKGS